MLTMEILKVQFHFSLFFCMVAHVRVDLTRQSLCSKGCPYHMGDSQKATVFLCPSTLSSEMMILFPEHMEIY